MGQRLVFLLRRAPHLTREAFQQYWRHTHAPLVCSVADVLGITGYHQVHTVRDGREGTVAGFDGVAELWFGPSAATTTERQQAEAMLLGDERRFIDLATSPLWLADEVVLHDGGPSHNSEARRSDGALRMTAALRRLAGTTRPEFLDHWHDVHGPLALHHPDVFGFGHYVQLHTPLDAESFAPAVGRGAPAPFDGVSEIWLDDVHPDAGHAAEVRSMIMTDEATFLDYAASPICFGRVEPVI